MAPSMAGGNLVLVEEDFDLIMKQHKIISNKVMHQRSTNLKKVSRWWAQGNVVASLQTLIQINDLSVSHDFI